MNGCSESRRRDFLKRAAVGSAGFAAGARGAMAQGERRIVCGQIGTKHSHAAGKMAAMRTLSSLYRVAGVVEPDEAQWRKAREASAYRGLKRLTEEELLNDASIEAVAVETEPALLTPTALRCARAGKHIHLDKPPGESMSAYRELRREADARGRVVQLGYMLRYNPAFELLFRAVREGWLGRVSEVSGAMGKMASDDLRDDLSQYAGGGMYELACHLIDAAVTILGRPDRVRAFHRSTRPERDAFRDNQLAVLEYPRALATIRCNHVDPIGFARRSFSVIGDQGAVEIRPLEPPRLSLSLTRPAGGFSKGRHEPRLRASTGRYDDEFRDLARAIRFETPLAWDTEHDLATHETVLRASGLPVD